MNNEPALDNNGLLAKPVYHIYNPWVVAFSVMLATFMLVLDSSIANVALPHIAGNLSATVDEGTWVLTSFLVANGVVLPLSGWLSQLFGRKRLYITCVFLFTLTSFLCGLAPNLSSLIVFRILQGFSGGAMQPLSQSILVENFPREKRGMAMAVYGMGVVVAPIIGPTLGGWITDSYNWRWIFFINVPTGIVAIILNAIVLHDPPHLLRKTSLKGVHFDLIGLCFLSLGLGSLQLVLDKGQKEDWFSSRLISSLTVIFVLSLSFALIWEFRRKEPIINLHLFKDRDFSIATGILFVTGFGLYGSTVLLPLFLQTLMGYNSLNSGLVMSPGGLVTLIAMPIVGFLTTRVHARWLISAGLLISALGLFQMARFDLNLTFNHAMISRMIISGGLAFLFVPINAVAYAKLPKQAYDQAAGLINLSRNLGASFGISFVTTLLARRTQFHQNMLTSYTNEYNPAFAKMAETIKAGLISKGESAYTAAIHSKALIYRLVQQQAMTLSYIDAFWVLGVMFILIIPFIFFLRDHNKV